MPPQPVVSDQAGYLATAERLLRHGYFAYGYFHSRPNAQIQPGYPLFLTLALAVQGAHPLALIHLLQLLLAIATLYVLMRLALDLLSPWAAFAVTLALGLYAPLLHLPTILMSENLSLFFWSLALWMAVRRRWLALGVAAGLAALVRPPALAALVAAVVLGGRARDLARAGLAAGLVMTPWWLRNALVFHRFVPFSTDGADPLFVGTFRSYRAAHLYLARHVPHPPDDPFLYAQLEQNLALHRIAERWRAGLGGFLRFYVVDKARYVFGRVWVWPNPAHVPWVAWAVRLASVGQRAAWALALGGLGTALAGDRNALYLALTAASQWAVTLAVTPQPRYLLPGVIAAVFLAALFVERVATALRRAAPSRA
jgi:hypothetical protein